MASTTFFIIGGVLLVIGIIMVIVASPKKTVTHETWHKVILIGGIVLALIGVAMLVWGFIKRSKEKKLMGGGVEIVQPEVSAPAQPEVRYVMQYPQGYAPPQPQAQPQMVMAQPQMMGQPQMMMQPQGQPQRMMMM